VQPLYVTLTSTTPSPWRLANWHAQPQQIAFQVISSGGSSWIINGTLEDPTGVYPNPTSSTPTPFVLATGSSNVFISLGTSAIPIAAYQFTINAQSSAAAPVTFVTLQSGIG
jgi:hypothetical protein